MKTLANLTEDFNVFSKSLMKRLVTAQRNTANKICEDVKVLAPSQTGEYVNSIKVSETVIENGVEKTVDLAQVNPCNDIYSVFSRNCRTIIGRNTDNILNFSSGSVNISRG